MYIIFLVPLCVYNVWWFSLYMRLFAFSERF
nr:MAG TPA: hypothetical protein [Caudoviricetes sp.]DAS01874.1 MAG TPA: hypothetical protein [Caudoviricetes sp.]